MRCEDAITRFVEYLNGSLGGPERHELEKHLASCPTCHAETAGLSQTWERLAGIPEAQPDVAAMRVRFDAMLADSVRQASRIAPPGGRIRSWLQLHVSSQPLVQVCAAVLLLLAGIQLGRELRPYRSSEVQELSQEVRNLQQTVALSLMQQDSASERLRGVGWSNQLDHPGNEVATALIDALTHDANVDVRLASIDALKRFAERDVVRGAAIHALDTQSSPLVQMALIDFVVETQDRGALGTLRRLAQDDTVEASVRNRAAWGVKHLEAV
jgi:hypothetical protein